MKRILPLILMLLSIVQFLRAQQDCANAILICDDGGLNFNPVGIGNMNDLSNPNNQPGCLFDGESNSVWYQFQISDNAPSVLFLECTLTPNAGAGEDYDFALYGPNADCGALGSPVRCSYAGSSCTFCPKTGIGNGATDTSEGPGGDGFVAPLEVHPGEVFYLLINNYSASGNGFTLNWSGSAKPYLNCCTLAASADATWNYCQEPVSKTVNLKGFFSDAQNGTSFQWSGPYLSGPNSQQTTADLPPNFSGEITWELIVTDGLGCTASDFVTVTVYPNPYIDFDVVNPVCQNDGSITALPSGGLPTYVFNWNTGEGTTTISGLSDGSYTVTVHDGNGCSSTGSISISGPPVLSFLSVVVSPVSCFGFSDGEANVQAFGGEAPYSFSWGNGQIGATLMGVSAGEHYVTVTDVNGCTAIQGMEVTQPDPLKATFDIKDVSCFEGADGEILHKKTQGGTQPYQYSLDSGFFFYDTTFTELVAGEYLISVEDSNGCLWSETYWVEQPPFPLEVDLGPDTTTVLGGEFTIEPIVNCSQGNIEEVIWTPFLCDNCFDPKFVPLNTETYEVKIIDRLGCVATDRKVVRVSKEYKIFVPNVFSPNEDGVNDFLEVFTDGSVSNISSFRVFNRWGGMLYEAFNFEPNQYGFGWHGESEGQPAPPGVYVYVLTAQFIDGYEETLGGDVLLLR